MKKSKSEEVTVKVGPKYQVVIPKKVREAWNIKIKPGQKVRISGISPWTVTMSIKPMYYRGKKTWAERTSGMLKGCWSDIEPTKYVRKIREEWD